MNDDDPNPPDNMDQPDDEQHLIIDNVYWGIDLGGLISGELSYSTQDLVRALSESTMVVQLVIDFEDYYPTEQDDPLFVQFLLQYIRNRTHLREVDFSDVRPGQEAGLVLQQFVMAAADSGTIVSLWLERVRTFSVQALAAFCRANRNVKILHLRNVTFQDQQLDLQAFASDHVLDHLRWDSMEFESREIALSFANLAQYLKLTDLSVGEIGFDFVDEGEGEILTRILSGLVKSSVKRLNLRRSAVVRNPCASSSLLRYFSDIGIPAVEELSADLGRDRRDDFDLFANSILPDMAKLKVLRLFFFDNEIIRPAVKKRLFREIDASVTLTEIRVRQVNPARGFSPDELQLLYTGRTQRNRELSRFLASPPQYPAHDLLQLMLQMTNCPTGRYELARNLPKSFFRATR